jgi:hypothetical protein
MSNFRDESVPFPLLSQFPSQLAGKGAKKVAAFLHLSSPFPPPLNKGGGKEGKGATGVFYLSQFASFLPRHPFYETAQS